MKRLTNDPRTCAARILVLVLVDVMLCGVALADPSWTITQVSNHNVGNGGSPDISGTNVVWVGGDDTPRQIYSNFAGQVSHETNNAAHPHISGTNVVWTTSVGGYSQVFSNFAGQLSDSSTLANSSPAISGTNVVWQGYSEAYVGQVYSNFGGQLTHYSHVNGTPYTGADRPAISGTNVVWEQYTGGTNGHSEIYSNFADPWSGPYTFNLYPAISGTNVIWISTDNHANAVLYSNFAGALSDPSIYCVSAAISGTNVIWLDGNWQLHTNFGGLVPIGSHYGGEPAISGTNVVWLGRDVSDNDWEIYMATYTPDVVPLPGAVLLGALGLGVAGLKLRKCA